MSGATPARLVPRRGAKSVRLCCQAEDGIRDIGVTGVQTCALPIYYPSDPIFHGEKITFKPTKNLQFGFSRTTEFGGDGRAMTLGAIWHSYVAYTSSVNYGPNDNPGHRVGGFDFSYKLPFVRNWLSLSPDAMTSDDPSPIDAPRRAPIDAGLYLAKFPHIPKLDLRVEGIFTDTTT